MPPSAEDKDSWTTNQENLKTTTQDRDLTFVAPERREEVLRRIGVVERFMIKPGRANAVLSAAELGLGVAQFYNLVKVWREKHRPEAIAGAGKPRSRRSGMDPAQLSILESAVTIGSRASTAEIIEAACRAAEAAGISLPDRGTVARYVRRTRPPLLTSDIKSELDLLVDHTVLDLAVEYGNTTPMRPLATMVIDVAAEAIIGLALAPSTPSVRSTAEALLDALRRSNRNEPRFGHKPRFGIVARPDEDVTEILAIVGRSGFDTHPVITGAHQGGKAIEALLGSRQAGIRLKPRLVWNEGVRRQARVARGTTALTPEDAVKLVRGRLLHAGTSKVFGCLKDVERLRLIKELTGQIQAHDRV